MVCCNLALLGFLIVLMLLCLASCSQKVVQPQYITVHRIDTVLCNTVQYDSVYTDRWHETSSSHDTVTVRDVIYKYKYKVLRDSAYITRVDTVPVVRDVVRSVPRPLAWWDYTAYSLSVLLIGFGLFKMGSKVRSLF